VFIDSRVFFAAAYSAHGSARDLLTAAVQGDIRLIVSGLVLEDTERNLIESALTALLAFLRFLRACR